jgi:acetylcholinesterase
LAKFFAENMNCSIETVDEVFNCLKEASHENIIQVVLDSSQSWDMSSAAIVDVTPTIDGKFIRKNPANMIKKADTDSWEEIDFFRSIKLINGVNGNEGGLFLIHSETLEDLEITREQMNTQVVPGIMAMMYGNKPLPEFLKQLIISEYTDWENPDDPKRLREQAVELFGDIHFNVPGIEMSRFHSNASNADSYVYHFLPKLAKPLFPLPKWVKHANHGDELIPVFGYNFHPQVLSNISENTPPEWELDLSIKMMKYWTNFAKTG